MRRPFPLALCVALPLLACGGSARDTRPPDDVEVEEVPASPVEIEVEAHRSGAALRLDVRAVGASRREDAAFEDPTRWTISATQDGQPIQRLTNGSSEISREESAAGSQRWNTQVTFNLTFQVAGDGEVVVRLTPPGERPTVRRFEPAAMADEGAVVADAGPIDAGAAALDPPIGASPAKAATAAASAEAEPKSKKAKKKKKSKKARRAAKPRTARD
jgi:hypothetical protein